MADNAAHYGRPRTLPTGVESSEPLCLSLPAVASATSSADQAMLDPLGAISEPFLIAENRQAKLQDKTGAIVAPWVLKRLQLSCLPRKPPIIRDVRSDADRLSIRCS